MPGWDGYDVPAHISAKLGGPVLVDNDVNIMALGEHATIYPGVEHLVQPGRLPLGARAHRVGTIFHRQKRQTIKRDAGLIDRDD